MPAETLSPRPPAPNRSPGPTLPVPDKEADALRGFAHIVLDFTAQARTFLAPHVDVSDPTSVACFVSKLASPPISTDVGHLLSGPFKDLLNFANLFLPSSSTPPQQPHTARDADRAADAAPHHSQPRSFLDALVANVPAPPTRRHTQLPRLLPGQPTQSHQLQPDTYQVSKRCTSSLQRAAIAACGHEEKAYAVVKTAPNSPPLRHPANLRHVFREGRAPGSHVVFPTHDPRILLVCGPKSALPLLQTAYNRTRDFTRARGCMLLPEVEISPVQDPLSLAHTPSNKLDLLQAFRDEISRLDSPANEWRSRRFYAATLADTEAEMYNRMNEADWECDLEPYERQNLVRRRPEEGARPPSAAPHHQDEMEQEDQEEEVDPPAKLIRHN